MYSSRYGFPRRYNSVNLNRNASTIHVRPINFVNVPPYVNNNNMAPSLARNIMDLGYQVVNNDNSFNSVSNTVRNIDTSILSSDSSSLESHSVINGNNNLINEEMNTIVSNPHIDSNVILLDKDTVNTIQTVYEPDVSFNVKCYNTYRTTEDYEQAILFKYTQSTMFSDDPVPWYVTDKFYIMPTHQNDLRTNDWEVTIKFDNQAKTFTIENWNVFDLQILYVKEGQENPVDYIRRTNTIVTTEDIPYIPDWDNVTKVVPNQSYTLSSMTQIVEDVDCNYLARDFGFDNDGTVGTWNRGTNSLILCPALVNADFETDWAIHGGAEKPLDGEVLLDADPLAFPGEQDTRISIVRSSISLNSLVSNESRISNGILGPSEQI